MKQHVFAYKRQRARLNCRLEKSRVIDQKYRQETGPVSSVCFPGNPAQPTEVERLTDVYAAVKVNSITGPETLRAQTEIFEGLPSGARKSVTLDNGRENHSRFQLRDRLGIDTFFCDPYSSWQRGCNEHHNGLLRRYLPKGTSFGDLTQEELDDMVREINNRPRKRLEYNTPREEFERQLKCCTSK